MDDSLIQMVTVLAKTLFSKWEDVEDAKQEGLLKILAVQAKLPRGVTKPELREAVWNHLLNFRRSARRLAERERKTALVGPRDHELAGRWYDQTVEKVKRQLDPLLRPVYYELVKPSREACDRFGIVRHHLIGKKLGLSRQAVGRIVKKVRASVEEIVRL